MLIALPAFSSGATVNNDLRSFQSAQPQVGSTDPPATKPPLHGTNPHAQGTAAVVDLAPSAARPYTVDANGNSASEDIIIGRSRGEQRADGTYHGHITVASAFGNEIIGRDTVNGQTVNEAIAEDLLNNLLCTPLNICPHIVQVRSSTTTTQSLNSFSLANATLGGTAGVPGLRIGAAESVGDITTTGSCQTSSGGSQVTDITAATAVANVARSTSTSNACRGQAATQANTSSVIQLGTTPVNVPLINSAGCGEGTADVETGLPPLLPIVCNADDSSTNGGNQAAAPYGVRNALDVYVLATVGSAVAQVSAAQSESLAVAPAAVVTPPPPPVVTPPTTTTPAATPPPAPTATTPATPATGTGTNDDTGDNSGNAGAGDNAPAGNGGSGGSGNGSPQCSDKVDNDGDGVIDSADPGCHSDGNAGNPASYNPNDDSEANGGASISGKQLPFTGTDVVLLGLAGALLLAAGLTLRGPARRRETNA